MIPMNPMCKTCLYWSHSSLILWSIACVDDWSASERRMTNRTAATTVRLSRQTSMTESDCLAVPSLPFPSFRPFANQRSDWLLSRTRVTHSSDVICELWVESNAGIDISDISATSRQTSAKWFSVLVEECRTAGVQEFVAMSDPAINRWPIRVSLTGLYTS